MDLMEAIERLQAMEKDRGETWDLSPNDQEAIGLVLNALAEKVLEAAKNRDVG